MSMERLSQQVDAYVAWKRELMREITRYRSWLAHNRLGSPAVEAKLDRALKILRTDHITLAFVGEFSRGKTELINCLFFSQFGQRMLQLVGAESHAFADGERCRVVIDA